ncbi:KamA family radical SAM protein [Patescibacteria group bacterium]|nr:KamA family radical SAM protein [Patescibacteria group bacterium]
MFSFFERKDCAESGSEDEDDPSPAQETVTKTISSPVEIAEQFGLDKLEIAKICEKYPAIISSYYLSLIREKGDGIYKQCVPSAEELTDEVGLEDPLHEEPEHQSREGIPALLTHRYPDRVLFRVSNRCAMYCRFCTRKRKVGDPQKQPTDEEINEALEYISRHSELRDVILSGGDPLMLSNDQLEKILSAVFKIINPRNGIIRIGTRIPCVLPQRISPELCKILKKYHPLFINTHFNHPNEITAESRRACALLADAGIPLGCQTVLLRGVNDDPQTMKELMQGLLSMRVRPYYIFQADLVKGTNHFRTRVEKGLEIYKSLRGFTSGLGVPTYVIDSTGGGGKIPAMPKYIEEISEEKVKLKNYEGKSFEYLQAIE